MIHDANGNMNFQPYGQKRNEVIFSVSRSNLNKKLMNYAESTNLVNFYFNHALKNIDLKKSELSFNNNDIPFSVVLGSDGASSIVRDFMGKYSNATITKNL